MSPPDSFSDGGQFLKEQDAFRHAEQMVDEGATILDVGGESSRPGSEPVPLEEELQRVIPVMRRLRNRFPELFLSIDTYKAETARQALAAGADIINDISALRAEPAMLEVLQHWMRRHPDAHAGDTQDNADQAFLSGRRHRGV
jgi:dihydropteroate synthase